MDLALKSERIAELSGKLNGFADFENTAVRGSAANFVLDCGPRLSRSSHRGSIVDLRRSLSVRRHFLHYVWDESFFLPKLLKMSMSFTFTSL